MVNAIGELKERIERNKQRLDCEEYSAPNLFACGGAWPGDWPGRTLLALCEHYEASNRKDRKVFRQLSEIVDALPEYTNAHGYFGELFDGVTVNEQQVSGNSWFIRGLCDYYRITGDKATFNRLNSIGENFLVKLKPFYEKYPLVARGIGGVDGHITERKSIDGWLLSSDVGCAFIMTDGITDLYDVTRSARVAETIKVMIDKFLSVDCVAHEFQTHATLSATRGILRMYKITGEEAYLSAAKKIFALYVEHGRTVNYANFNWFGRPLTWTEPCAFIDSIILASELYFATSDYEYLAFANRAYHNAIATAQRSNGGAGCETCLSEQNDVLCVHQYEARGCCTMRLANGLNYIRAHAVIESTDGYVALFSVGGEYESDECKFVYGFDLNAKCIRVNVLRGKVDLKLYMPVGVTVIGVAMKGGFAKLSGLNCGLYEYKIEVQLQEENYNGLQVYFYADRLCTEKQYNFPVSICFDINGRKLSPIDGCIGVEEKLGIDAFVQKI